MVSVEVARQMLGGRGRGKVYALLDAGELESVKDGGRRLILTESLLAYVERLRAHAGRSTEARPTP